MMIGLTLSAGYYLGEQQNVVKNTWLDGRLVGLELGRGEAQGERHSVVARLKAMCYGGTCKLPSKLLWKI